jgi:hypothetical protein
MGSSPLRPVLDLATVENGDARSDLERLREVVSLRVFCSCVLSGLGLEAVAEFNAFPLRIDRISLCLSFKSGTLLTWRRGSGNRFNSAEKPSSSSGLLTIGCVLRRMF